MNRKLFLIVLFAIFINLSYVVAGWKELDLNAFKISIPKDWNYQQMHGEDSFAGRINGLKSTLVFDYSTMGYANNLIPTEQEYLKNGEWESGGYFYKTGVTYTADFNVKKEREAQMKKLGTTDSTLVHVEADPSYQTKTKIHLPTVTQKIKFPKADYIADLTFKDSTIDVPIEIPEKIKLHNIKTDTTEKYIIKTMYPKTPGNGITGIYIKGRSTRLTFNLAGMNLSKQDQDLALQAFKTIEIK